MQQPTPTLYKHQNQNLISYAIIFLLTALVVIALYSVFFQAKTVVPDNQKNTVSESEAEKKPVTQNKNEQSIKEPVEQQAEKPIVQSTGSLTAEDITAISDRYSSIVSKNPNGNDNEFSIIDGEQVDNVLSKYLPANEPRRISYNRQVEEFTAVNRKTALVFESGVNPSGVSYTHLSLMFQDSNGWQYYSSIGL